MKKLPKNFGKMKGEPKETDCYYPSCRKRGKEKLGTPNAHFLLCEEHFDLAIFIRDMFDFKFQNP